MSITSFLPPVCPYFNKNTDQVAKRWNEPSSVNPNFSSSPQNSFSLLFRSVYLGGESEVLAFFQGLLTSDVSIIIIVLLLGLYRISGWPDIRPYFDIRYPAGYPDSFAGYLAGRITGYPTRTTVLKLNSFDK